MNPKNINFTKRQIRLALLIAMGGALHLVESLIILPLPIPGLKPGLANVVTVVALYLFGTGDALIVGVGRVVVGSLAGGLLFSPAFFLALAGTIVSTPAMAIFKKCRWFSVIGVCLAGATAHNLGQLSMAMFILQNKVLLYYLPLLIIFSIPGGLFTGYVMKSLLHRIGKKGILPI